jgi:hypothetical protein
MPANELNCELSVVDAIVTATAIEKSAILIHKDSELEPISRYVTTLKLPF